MKWHDRQRLNGARSGLEDPNRRTPRPHLANIAAVERGGVSRADLVAGTRRILSAQRGTILQVRHFDNHLLHCGRRKACFEIDDTLLGKVSEGVNAQPL